mgnify:CR=1 FL=1
MLVVILTNLPILYSSYFDNDLSVYNSALFVRFIGLSAFISTIIYTLYTRELMLIKHDPKLQLKILVISYILLLILFSTCLASAYFVNTYIGIPLDFLSIGKVSINIFLPLIIVLLPIITIGNIIGFLLLVNGNLNFLIISQLLNIVIFYSYFLLKILYNFLACHFYGFLF